MKINKVDVLITKVELKENKEGKNYLMISMLDLVSGDNFDIMNKDLEMLGKLKPMTKAKVDLNLSSSKFGLKLELVNILEQLGGI